MEVYKRMITPPLLKRSQQRAVEVWEQDWRQEQEEQQQQLAQVHRTSSFIGSALAHLQHNIKRPRKHNTALHWLAWSHCIGARPYPRLL